MKTTLLFLVLVSQAHAFDVPVTSTNYTPEFTQPTDWPYAKSPGTYFWTGTSFGFAVVVTSFCFAMLRNTVHDSGEL